MNGQPMGRLRIKTKPIKIMRPLFALIIILFSYNVLLAQDEKQKKELEQLSVDWMNAWKTQDTVLLKKIIAPEFRLLSMVNGELMITSREKWLSNGPYYILKSFRYYDFDIRIYGNTAIVQSKYDQEAMLNGKDRSGTLQITDVWVKNKSDWQVVHRHTNLKPKTL
jgi:ketosteroid isomerase-like protein